MFVLNSDKVLKPRLEVAQHLTHDYLILLQFQDEKVYEFINYHGLCFLFLCLIAYQAL